ncbi:hypothetical protein [Campylobacter sp. 19-13652]|uniref:hypothetical protein n=1 Tax=Campylobacter sp. 19-13652 TaxID=2840180 RepID=UPI001C77CF7F|nr:hypothetical protein [Campylobacter sp. 19-13652]BCX78555.1 hypothetical protein LBC_00170 [Campylobacter sp. 19-13652]
MQRILLFLSILLILCAVGGIFLFMPKAKPQTTPLNNQTQTKQIDKKEFIYVVAKDDIYAAAIISKDNTKFESLQYENELPTDFKDALSKDEFLSATTYAANRHIIANEKITKSMLLDTSSTEYAKLKLAPSNGLLSFMFELDERNWNALETVKPGGFVDIFFRYETKNPKKDEGIAPKKRKDTEYRNYDTANITTLMPVFTKKRVLFKQHIKSDELKDSKDKGESGFGQIFIEISQDNAKKIYAIENLGNFFIFPAQNEKLKVISTEKVLQKEFIKELRGGANAQ